MKGLKRRNFLKMGMLSGIGVATYSVAPYIFGHSTSKNTTLSKKGIERIIGRAIAKGADFAETYNERSVISSITVNSRTIARNETQSIRGLGLRTFINDEVQHQWSEDFSEKGISDLISKMKEGQAMSKEIEHRTFKELSFPEISPVKIPPENTPMKRKLEYLREVEHFAYDFDKRIKDVILLYQDKTQDLFIANSDGLFVQGKRSDIILIVIALAEHKGAYSIGCSFIGGNIGSEIFYREIPGKIAKEAANQALELLNPKPIPKEKLSIIFANKSGIFHECLGHPLEARHREGVFKGKLNEQLTSQPLTVIDDATIPDLGGSFSFDDEGTKSQRKVLIEKGILRGFMYDRYFAKKYDVESTGNGRRASYKFPPLARMSNFMIEAGNIPFEEILKDTKRGILAVSGSGGRSFVMKEAYMLPFYAAFSVVNGRVAYPLQPFIYQGTILKTMQNIDMIGNDFIQSSTGKCGLEQVITVTYGAPSIRLKEAEKFVPLDINQFISELKNSKL